MENSQRFPPDLSGLVLRYENLVMRADCSYGRAMGELWKQFIVLLLFLKSDSHCWLMAHSVWIINPNLPHKRSVPNHNVIYWSDCFREILSGWDITQDMLFFIRMLKGLFCIWRKKNSKNRDMNNGHAARGIRYQMGWAVFGNWACLIVGPILDDKLKEKI